VAASFPQLQIWQERQLSGLWGSSSLKQPEQGRPLRWCPMHRLQFMPQGAIKGE
jgi:hypothetical protein